MRTFINLTHTARRLSNILAQKGALLAVLLFGILLSGRTWGQNTPCSSIIPTKVACWDFNSPLACNGAVENPFISSGVAGPVLGGGRYTYCPNSNAGCAKALLGSKGFTNTDNFAYAMCLYGYYSKPVPLPPNSFDLSPGWSPDDTQFHPEIPSNLFVTYTIPANKVGSVGGFALKYLQKQFNGTTVNFEKQGVGVYRDGVLIYSQTQAILPSNVNATPILFTFPDSPEFYSDGSKEVKFEIVFGLVHRLVGPGNGETPAATGYDDFCVYGSCGVSKAISVTARNPTCSLTGVNNNGKITLGNFTSSTDKYDYTMGSTYTGTATSGSGSTLIPVDGVIVQTLPNPASPQPYTIRVFTLLCYTDVTTTINPTTCGGGTSGPAPNPCTLPTATVSPTVATCTASSPSSSNADAKLAITGVSNGDRVNFSAGSSYTGSLYADAKSLVSGAYTFTNLANPDGSQTYTIRVFNGNDFCFTDYTVTLNETVCGCKKLFAQVITTDADDPDSFENNGIATEDDMASYELCKSTKTIDLALTQSVSPSTGTTCPTATPFVWTLTLQNKGTMTAKNIQVADLFPNGLILTGAIPSAGTFSPSSGWLLDSLQANQTATLAITTTAIKAGTFQNCAEIIRNYYPDNDTNLSNHNSCASITVTGPSTPSISKEFSPMLTKPNVPTRLTIKIVNNESTPVSLTSDFVDTFPTSMVVATSPNVSSVGMTLPVTGIAAVAGSGSITIPQGTVLSPGLNQMSVDITVPSNGNYCNDIAAGALKTTSCSNMEASQACILANSRFDMAPIVKKTMLPSTIQTGQTGVLTITIENKNGSAMTLNQDFIDKLPTSLVASGAVTSSCGGASLQNGNTELKIAGGTVIAANSTCTITVNVTSSTTGNYCNTIPMNTVLTTVGTNNNLGNEDIAQACINVVANPCTAVGTISFTQSPSGTVTPGTAVTLTASATGISNKSVIQWASAAGSFNNVGINPTIWTAPATEGTYTISLTANNATTGYGTCTATATTTILVQTPAVPCTAITAATATVTPTSIATGSSATLDVTATASGIPTFSYAWAGAGGFTSATKNPSTGTLGTAGNYSYTVTVTNNDGTGTCTATATASLSVSSAAPTCTPPTGVSITISPATITASGSITLSSASTGATNWSWASSPNSFISTLQNPGSVTAPATAGTYTYTVTASHSANPSCTATATAMLTVSATVANIALSLKKIASKANPVSGDNVTFTVIITNAGPNNATGVKLKDVLPTGLTLVSVSTGVGSYNSATGIWDIGNVPVGQTTITMTVTVN